MVRDGLCRGIWDFPLLKSRTVPGARVRWGGESCGAELERDSLSIDYDTFKLVLQVLRISYACKIAFSPTSEAGTNFGFVSSNLRMEWAPPCSEW